MGENKDIFAPLDEEEKELIQDIESGEFVVIKNSSTEIELAKKYAASTMKKDKRMNIRISERDLRNLKLRAFEEGIPYQTMVSMILHKYVTGQLTDKVS